MVTVVRGDVILCDLNPVVGTEQVERPLRNSEQKSRVVKANVRVVRLSTNRHTRT